MVASGVALTIGEPGRAQHRAAASIELADSLPVNFADFLLWMQVRIALAGGDAAAARRLADAQGVRADAPPVRAWSEMSLALWEGDAVRALGHVERVNEWEVPWDAQFPFTTLDFVEANVIAGDPAKADAVVTRMESMSRSLAKFDAAAKTARARLALHAGDLDAAAESARAAVVALETCHARAGMPDALRLLGLALVESGDVDRGVRIVAAGEAARASIGFVAPPYRLPVAHWAEQYADAWAEGAAMPWDEAVAYAQRGRGERKRPTAGWDSLTPTERQVVDLVAGGLSNKEIAERLFMALPTVKSHLTHVYGKLGLSSRTQLTAEAARR